MNVTHWVDPEVRVTVAARNGNGTEHWPNTATQASTVFPEGRKLS